MQKFFLGLWVIIPAFLIFTACNKDEIEHTDNTDNIDEEILFLTVWEYDVFGGQNLKSGSFWNYYKRGITGSSLAYSHDADNEDDYLFAYEIVPQQNIHHVFFTENGSGQSEKKFEYTMSGEYLSEIKVFHQETLITRFNFSYNSGQLVNISQGSTEVVSDITYDATGNITRIVLPGVSSSYFHFKVCESKNPYKGLFRNFNLNNLHLESLFSIISFLNPNFVLDVVNSNNADFDWSTHSTCISVESNENNYPHLIREKKFDTQGNLVNNKIIAEYEYH